MHTTLRVAAGACAVLLLSGCPGVPYNPATNNDITPPNVGIRVTGDAPAPASDWDSGTNAFKTRTFITPVDVGPHVQGTAFSTVSVPIHEHGEAHVLATAQDNESGVKSLVLTCQRRVYYNFNPSGPTESNAVLEIKTTQQNNQLNNGQAPLSALTQQDYNMWGQMVFSSSQGTPIRGHRVSRTCTAEATNFNGISARTEAALVWAQDHAVQP